MYRKLIVYIAFVAIAFCGLAKDPLRDSVSIEFKSLLIKEALQKLEANLDYRFSYNPDLIPKRIINQSYTDRTLNYILDDILNKEYNYLVRGSFIILTPIKSKKEKASTEIKGEVVDAETGKQISNATIYEVNRLTSTLSSADGTYQMDTKTQGKGTVVAISKQNYEDTVITLSEVSQFLKISLQPIQQIVKDTIEIPKFLVGERIKNHIRNIDLTAERIGQVSFVPGLSTSGELNNQITNNLSLNVIGGYSGGLSGLEIGGLFNLDRKAIDGIQIAGAVNAVGGPSSALQIAGAYNHSQQAMSGIQIAGAVNTVNDNIYGIQIAGAVNYSKNMFGLQAGGAVNIMEDGNGLQLGGVINQSTKHLRGMQVAGVVNSANNVDGLQLAGLLNIGRDTVNGAQISGFINKAKRLTGAQIGFINIAKKLDHGTQIGIFNISKNGLTAFDFEYNDVTEYNFSFKSGAKHFYTILATGLSQKKDIWTTGFGFGSQHNMNLTPFYVSFELSSHVIYPTNQKIEGFPLDSRFNLDLGIDISRRISIHGGPVLHFLYYPDYQDYPDFRIDEELGEYTIYEGFKNNYLNKWWVGYRVGIRL